jgi:uncharacterized protein (TIGR02598 family)
MKIPGKRASKAFSLIEVVVAVGIFALTIVGVIGLISPTNKAVADVADNDSASRAISAIQAGLQQAGFATIKSYLDNNDSQYGAFYASKSGDKVGTSEVFNDDSEKFFEFSLTRNNDLSPATNDETSGFLVFTINIRWPAYLPNGVKFETDEQKSLLVVPAAITR